jgi:ECF sigma factor
MGDSMREAQQVVEVGTAMEKVEASDSDAARIVDMVYFAGFTLEEAAKGRRGLTLRCGPVENEGGSN